MDQKKPPPRRPGTGRRSGIGLDQSMPEYDGPDEEEEQPPPPPRPAPPPVSPPPPQPPGLIKRALSGFLTPPANMPPPPATPKPADRGPRLERDPYGDELGLLYDDDPPPAKPPAPKAEEAPEPEPPPKTQTSRLSTADLDMGNNALSGENSGIKWKSDRARWW
ncbi:MAG: hypothetical protein FJZ01_22820 [Candidatus Sericytochromatia bacterium]|nr:hypothetical protein [Candidatus Tanganyikabacteria bacterium]